MLEVLPHDREHAYPLTRPDDAGPQGAYAADDQIYPYPGLCGGVQGCDASRIDQGVELQDDPGGSTGSRVVRLALDHVQDPGAQVHGCDDQPPEILLARQAGQHIEEVAYVSPELRAT